MRRVIFNEKGGVGKSTVSVNVAVALSISPAMWLVIELASIAAAPNTETKPELMSELESPSVTDPTSISLNALLATEL